MNARGGRRAPALLGLVCALVAGTACRSGPTGLPPGDAATTPPPVTPVLSVDAVPGIPFTTHALTASELTKDAPLPTLARNLATWGFVGGRERTFQGESKHLTFVQSRSLAFASTGGADAFVGFVHEQATRYFGVGTRIEPIVSSERRGWLFVPPACACHLANPVDVGVLVDGREVVWLEINGPDATRPLLLRLLSPSNFASR